MGRQSLGAGHGLFIDGTNGIHMFFMRFPIDAVFVGKPGSDPAVDERIVVSVHRNVRPWIGIVPLVWGAAGVLELPVGTIDSSGTAPGDRVRLG
jgi:hypothetical protein